MNKKVLVIDDDPTLGKLIGEVLKPLQVSVHLAFSGAEGLKQTYAIHPDLVILDVMMPDMDGFEVCSRLHEFSEFPILMLTARTHENDLICGFNVGANDYMRKPFSNVELVARVRALLSHANPQNDGEVAFISAYADPVLQIDLTASSVKLKGKVVDLSPREYDLLACLVREQGSVISHRELARKAWGELFYNNLSESSLYIYYLRKKLEDGKNGHEYIRTLWGRGYWFEPRNETKLVKTSE